jgi:nitrogenase molybdenum-iron protein alpha chain
MTKLKNEGVPFANYEGMMSTMENQTLIIDDISQAETEKLLEIYKPAIFCAGIKEKYTVQKTGTPMLQLHSYDYGGPFAVFKGAINFYKTIDRMVNAKIWGYVKPPWKTKTTPILEAALVSES